ACEYVIVRPCALLSHEPCPDGEGDEEERRDEPSLQERGPGEPGSACRPRAHMEDNAEGGWERMDLGRARDRFLQRGEGLCHPLTRGAGVEVAAEGEFFFRFQLAVDKSTEVFQRFPAGRHGLLLSYMSSDGSNWARSLSRRARRARAMRERTVPI